MHRCFRTWKFLHSFVSSNKSSWLKPERPLPLKRIPCRMDRLQVIHNLAPSFLTNHLCPKFVRTWGRWSLRYAPLIRLPLFLFSKGSIHGWLVRQAIAHLTAPFQPTARQSVSGVAKLTRSLRKYDLTKTEKLQIVNLAPVQAVELYVVSTVYLFMFTFLPTQFPSYFPHLFVRTDSRRARG